MKQWIAFIFSFLTWPCQASEALPQTPLLTFEIAVKPDSELHRVVTGAMREIIQKQGYHFQTTNLPPMRGLQELKAGRVDGSVGRIGNVAKLLETKDLIRVDVPVAVFQVSRWCRKDLPNTQKTIKLGTKIGSMVLLLLKDHLALDNIQLEEIAHQKGVMQMFHAARLDCILSSELFLESDGVNIQELQAFDRFDFVSFEVYPWILKRHEALKEGLESGLRHYPFPENFRKKFLDQKPACEGKLNLLCPDGIIIKKKADLS